MLSRNLTLKLKANSILEFTRLVENETIPRLRMRTGFREEIRLVASQRSEAVAISFQDLQREYER